jgi:hypothetical protein
VPNVRLDHVQIDVYTSFRDQSGAAETNCILSTLVRRSEVEGVDWEQITAPEFVQLTGGRFSDSGSALLPVEPLPWEESARAEDASRVD